MGGHFLCSVSMPWIPDLEEDSFLCRFRLRFSQVNPLILPPSPPYYKGRWSNGPVWAELAAPQLGLPLQDLAVGGAGSGVRQYYYDGNMTFTNGTGNASFPLLKSGC
jgi:hypothetical protein